MEVEVVLMDSFTAKAGGGNPAGVVVNGEGLTSEQMLHVAKEVGFSETAFVSSSKNADFRVRFFTPAGEVDLCGHATIATFSHLFECGRIPSGHYTQETGAGVLTVEVKENKDVFMEQALPIFGEILPREEIARSLGITPEDFVPGLPIEIVSTGLRDILIPVKSLEALRSLKPDFPLIMELSKKYEAVGYHVFTLEAEKGGTAQCRNFAPLYDIPEESATGTSNGALACYLIQQRVASVKGNSTLVFEQGYTMGKPSEIKGIIEVPDSESSGEIKKVWIGGKALPSGKKIIKL